MGLIMNDFTNGALCNLNQCLLVVMLCLTILNVLLFSNIHKVFVLQRRALFTKSCLSRKDKPKNAIRHNYRCSNQKE